jgi:hypothetical protein
MDLGMEVWGEVDIHDCVPTGNKTNTTASDTVDSVLLVMSFGENVVI